MSQFSITNHKMKFSNGWTVSVQFGPANYCDNYNAGWDEPQTADRWSSGDAEIAAWDKNGKWHEFECDSVKGHVSADEVAEFIETVRAF